MANYKFVATSNAIKFRYITASRRNSPHASSKMSVSWTRKVTSMKTRPSQFWATARHPKKRRRSNSSSRDARLKPVQPAKMISRSTSTVATLRTRLCKFWLRLRLWTLTWLSHISIGIICKHKIIRVKIIYWNKNKKILWLKKVVCFHQSEFSFQIIF